MGGCRDDEWALRSHPQSLRNSISNRIGGGTGMSTIDIESGAVYPVEVGLERVELAVRERSGILVELHWFRDTEIVLVSVADRPSGTCFELVLEPGERALDVFHHPYAYAAARGLEVAPARTPLEEELIDV
jgi:hypothetical protein